MTQNSVPSPNSLDYRNQRSGYKIELGWCVCPDMPMLHWVRTTEGSILGITLCMTVVSIRKLQPSDTRHTCPTCDAYIKRHPEHQFTVDTDYLPEQFNPYYEKLENDK